MNFSALVIFVLAISAPQARSLPAPGAAVALRRALEPCPVSYEGRVKVETFISSAAATARWLSVNFAPPGFYRREIITRRRNYSQLVVSDGEVEWIYDPDRRKVWQGSAAPPSAGEEFARLAERYDVSISTGGRVARRNVWVIDLRARAGGGLRRRLWVDRRYGLILKSVLFGPDGAPAAAERFTQIKFGAAQNPALFSFMPPEGAGVVTNDFDTASDTSAVQWRAAVGMRLHLPRWLPLGYALQSAGVVPHQGASLLQYRFSDGLNALSLFEWPQDSVEVDFGVRAREKAALACGSGALVWSEEGPVLSWSCGGVSFALVGLLPAETLRRVADSIPEQAP